MLDLLDVVPEEQRRDPSVAVVQAFPVVDHEAEQRWECRFQARDIGQMERQRLPAILRLVGINDLVEDVGELRILSDQPVDVPAVGSGVLRFLRQEHLRLCPQVGVADIG